jgi:hypothetical protein
MRSSRHISRLLFTAVAPALAVALLAGCGGGEAADPVAAESVADTGAVDTTSDDADDADGESAEGASGSSDATRVCEALSAVDPDTVFADLTFGEPEPRSDTAWCRLPVTNAEGEGLTAGLDVNGLFELYQEQYGDNEDLYRDVDGVGDEAYIINDSQLHVRQGQDTWMVSLQAIVVMAEEPTMPAAESTEAGLTQIARSLLGQ